MYYIMCDHQRAAFQFINNHQLPSLCKPEAQPRNVDLRRPKMAIVKAERDFTKLKVRSFSVLIYFNVSSEFL